MKFILKPILVVVLAICFTLGFTPESRAAYLEPDTETPGPVDRVGDYHPPRPRYADNPVTRLVEQIEIGRPCQYRGLTIYPLHQRSAREFTDIKTLDEAVDNRWILIREKDRSMVSEVTVRNDSRYYVFLIVGELLLVGKLEGMALTWDNRMVHAALFGEWRHEDVMPIPKPYSVLPILNDDTIWR